MCSQDGEKAFGQDGTWLSIGSPTQGMPRSEGVGAGGMLEACSGKLLMKTLSETKMSPHPGLVCAARVSKLPRKV